MAIVHRFRRLYDRALARGCTFMCFVMSLAMCWRQSCGTAMRYIVGMRDESYACRVQPIPFTRCINPDPSDPRTLHTKIRWLHMQESATIAPYVSPYPLHAL